MSPAGIICTSSLVNTFNATIAKPYIITAKPIANIVANFSAIIPENTEYMKDPEFLNWLDSIGFDKKALQDQINNDDYARPDER